MKTYSSSAAASLLASALLLNVLPANAAPKAPDWGAVPPASERLDAAQVVKIFSGKSWVWSDGAAYFAPDQHFIAYTGDGDARNWAEGSWKVTQNGRLCFTATWRSALYKGPATTCFGHRIAGGVIYQQKEPGGVWYAFRHSPAQPDDEFQKLKSGDLASRQAARIAQQMTTQRPPRN